MDNLLTLEELSQESINEGSDKKIRSFYKIQKHDGIEIGDAVTITAKKFKKSEKEIEDICDDILDENNR